MSKRATATYEVGYRKPPENTQFQKGVSGNPKGRPKKSADFDQQLLRESNLPVVIHENGQQVRITKKDVVIVQLLHKAMKGELGAMKLYIAYHQQADERAASLAAQKAHDVDKKIRLAARPLSELTDEELDAEYLEALEQEELNKQHSRRE